MRQGFITGENDKMSKEMETWLAKNKSFYDSYFNIIPLCCDVLCQQQFATYRILYRYRKL
jgi:hypothetical protein